MASYEPIVRGAAGGAIAWLGLPSAATSATMQGNPTLAAGDVQISKDGGALANLATLPVVTPAGSRIVKVTLSAAEITADQVVIVFADQTTPKEWCDTIVAFNTVARQFNDLAFPNVSGRGMDVDAAGGVEVGSFQAGAITAAAFTAGAIDANAIATDAIGSAELAASAVTEIQAGLATAAGVPSAAQNADALLDRVDGVETGLTPRQWLRLAAAVLFGKASGMATTTAAFRDTPDTKNRVTATVDTDGNRSAVTLDPS